MLDACLGNKVCRKGACVGCACMCTWHRPRQMQGSHQIEWEHYNSARPPPPAELSSRSASLKITKTICKCGTATGIGRNFKHATDGAHLSDWMPGHPERMAAKPATTRCNRPGRHTRASSLSWRFGRCPLHLEKNNTRGLRSDN